MASTTIQRNQFRGSELKRSHLNTTESGNAVVAKIQFGDGIGLESTGADGGTGDVKVKSDAMSSTELYFISQF